MKLFVIFFLLSITATICYSKSNYTGKPFNGDIIVGVSNGPIKNFSTSDYSSLTDVFIGISSRYNFTENVMFETGIGQGKYGAYFNLESPITRLSYLEIPILIRSNISKSMSIGVGMNYNILYKARIAQPEIEDINVKSEFQNFKAICVDFRVGDQGFTFGVTYSKGLDYVTKDSRNWKVNLLKFHMALNIVELARARGWV